MDTSQSRYSIAALLDDRRGVVFDIPQIEAMAKRSGSAPPHSDPETHPISNDWVITSTANSTPTTNLPSETPPIFTDTYSTSPITDNPQPSNENLSPLPLCLIPHTLYRNLCSKTSPPLTVAISPSRHCTAFGSSSGIELHWQDSRTGQELSRWMDLLGPAEYIHFLPPNRAPENGDQHVRLVSSRAGPQVGCWEDVGVDGMGWYEHCRFLRAVPVSDGGHVLFTDPVDGRFWLGAGLERRFGETKPVRRVLLEGPKVEVRGDGGWPKFYKAARELRWGLRVVAVFGDEVWMFCVPPDWLGEGEGVEGEGEGEGEWSDGCRVVRGVCVGTMPGVTELAVHAEGGEITIRAFSFTTEEGRPRAMARVWQIARYPPRDVRYWTALNPGASGSAEQDRPGKVKMGDATEEIEMKHLAPGDWIHDVDEGYVSGDDDGPVEGSWNVRGQRGWRSRDVGWSGSESVTGIGIGIPVGEMGFVRLEVEVLCGG